MGKADFDLIFWKLTMDFLEKALEKINNQEKSKGLAHEEELLKEKERDTHQKQSGGEAWMRKKWRR